MPLIGTLFAMLTIGLLSIRPPPLSTTCSDSQQLPPTRGSVCEGIDPFGNSPDAVLGRSLVPDGLVPIAIFPSSRDQKVPALSVIFSESPSETLRYAECIS